jgi:hypothetical protein
MAHHESTANKETLKRLFESTLTTEERQRNEDMLNQMECMRLGATGEYPQGKLTREDEGEIRIATTSKDGKVILAFGKKIAWVGFTPQDAIDLGANLIQRGENLSSLRGKSRKARHSAKKR